jgi:hypothetical protein
LWKREGLGVEADDENHKSTTTKKDNNNANETEKSRATE